MKQQTKRVTSIKTGIPGPKSKELLDRWKAVEADCTGYQARTVWDTGSGSTVTDVDGNVFIDWTSGVIVTNVGHAHPHLAIGPRRAAGRG